MDIGIVHNVQWCDTRDMTAYGHTKGSIDRELLLEVMSGTQSFKERREAICSISGPWGQNEAETESFLVCPCCLRGPACPIM
eukprot:3067212-Pyramimonas_sp.AAC.1